MLLRFSVSNFGSLRDKQELSMIASNAIKDEPAGLIDAPELRKEKVLPAAVIYGANASGKSNFVKALAHMKDLVRDSHRRGEPGGPVALRPFLLDPAYTEKPSAFSADFIWNGARYSYEFEATSKKFTAEALYVWRSGPRSTLFERKYQTFEFGRSLKGRNKTIEDLTRPNSLFLSAAAQSNHEELTEIANFFKSTQIELTTPMPPELISAQLAHQGVDKKILNLLHEIDTGVTGTRVDETPLEQKYVDFRNAILAVIQQQIGTPPPLEVKSKLNEAYRMLRLGHQATDGQTVYLNMEDESAGTVQLLSILGPIFRALDEGRVVVLDEFGSRLHTRAAEIILSLFNNKETNPKGAQLIVATHDTNLLNAKGLRRDQVWFTEKDDSGATHLYPLTDIETRKGDNLEKGYLQGRYGAIPFAGSLANLVKAV
jgi:AAA15 family ATPase/GTPase